MPELLNKISTEIETLHSFLGDWLSGRLAKSDDEFTTGIRHRLNKRFYNIQPAGLLLSREQLISQIYRGYARSPGFRIKIRNVRVLNAFGEDRYVIAVYEEYQKNAKNSERKNNARASSVIFEFSDRASLSWLHIHETWLPEKNHDESLFEF